MSGFFLRQGFALPSKKNMWTENVLHNKQNSPWSPYLVFFYRGSCKKSPTTTIWHPPKTLLVPLMLRRRPSNFSNIHLLSILISSTMRRYVCVIRSHAAAYRSSEERLTSWSTVILPSPSPLHLWRVMGLNTWNSHDT